MIHVLFILALCHAGHIQTWDASLTYNMQGTINTLLLPYQLQNSLLAGSLSYLHFGGLTLHLLTPSEVYADILFANGST